MCLDVFDFQTICHTSDSKSVCHPYDFACGCEVAEQHETDDHRPTWGKDKKYVTKLKEKWPREMSGHGKTIKQCKNKTMMMITVKDTVNSGQKEKQ